MKKLLASVLAVIFLCSAIDWPFQGILAEGEPDDALVEITEIQEETSEEIPEAETQQVLTVSVPSSADAQDGTVVIRATASRSDVSFVWQHRTAAEAQGMSEEETEALWTQCGSGDTLTYENVTADDLFRCIVICGEEMAVSDVCTVNAKADEEEPEETVPAGTDQPDPTAIPETEVSEQPEAVEDTLSIKIIKNENENCVTAAVNGADESTVINYTWQKNENEIWTEFGSGEELSLEGLEGYSIRCLAAVGDMLMVSDTYEVPAVETAKSDKPQPITEIVFSEETAEVAEYHQITLTPEIFPAEAVSKPIVWSSSDTTVATVENGVVTGMKSGTCTITAAAEEDLSVSSSVSLTVTPIGYRVVTNLGDQRNIRLYEGQKVTNILAVVVSDADSGAATTETVKWKSSDTSVVKVDENSGAVTAMKAGTAYITAYFAKDESVCASIFAEVVTSKSSLPNYVYLTAEDTEIGVGCEEELNVTFDGTRSDSYTLTTSNPSVLMLTNSGTVVALGVGTAKLTATTFNGKTSSMTIEVKAAPKTITLSKTEMNISAGDKSKLIAEVDEGAASNKEFESSDEDVVKVSSDGAVTAVSAGTAVITAETYNGLTATCDVTVVPAPTYVMTEQETYYIGKGETIRLEPYTDVSKDGTYTYSSSSTRIATVTSDGVVCGKKAGSAKITVTAYNGVYTKAVIQVGAAPSSVYLRADDTVLAVGEQTDLSVSYNSGAYGAYELLSSNESVATVSQDGVVSTCGIGEVTIRAKAFNGKYADLKLQVMERPSSISFDRDTVQLFAEDSTQLKASVNDGAAGKISYTSSDESVVTVDENGNLYGVGAGKAYITASSCEVSNTCEVEVFPAVESMTLEAERDTIAVGEQLQLTAVTNIQGVEVQPSIVYTSSSTRYATVDSNGVVTAKRAGSATITARAYNGVTATFKVKVTAAPSKVAITMDHTRICEGDYATPVVTLTSGTVGAYELASEDESVCEIRDGKVYAVGTVGSSTRIGVRTFNGKTAVVTVTIVAAPSKLSVPKAIYTLAAGDSRENAAVTDNGESCTITYMSSDDSVATVDADGTIHAVAPGTATIRARSYNDKVKDTYIVVKEELTKIELVLDHTKIGVKETVALNVTADTAAQLEYTYTSSKTKYATIDSQGNITGKAAGTTTITVTGYNGTTASISVTVVKAPASVSLTIPRTKIALGEEFQVTAKANTGLTGGFAYAVDNTKVATISESGLLKAVGIGTAKVSVTTYNGKTASATIEVVAAPTELTLERDSCKLAIGDSYTIVATTDNGNVGEITYRSLNDTVTVDENGKVTAKEKGWGTVLVETYDGSCSDTFSVIVVDAVHSIQLLTPQTTMGVGQTMQIQTLIDNDTDLVTTLTYKVSNSTVGSISADGLFKAKAIGNCTVTATTYNGLSTSVKITVETAPTSIKISLLADTLYVGETTVASGKISYGFSGEGAYTFSSSDESIATVDPDNGQITAVGAGSCRIYVTTYNGKSAYKTLTVLKKGSSTVTGEAEEILSRAASKLGCSYVYGEDGPDTFDCSGFVRWVYSIYVTLPHNALQMSKLSYSKITSMNDLEPGDLVFFGSPVDHVGIYKGGTNMILVHASQSAGKVIESVMKGNSYYTGEFAWGLRVFS